MKKKRFILVVSIIMAFGFFCKEPVAKKFNHARTFFPLTGAHIGANCRDCHKDGSISSLPSDCQSCHPMTLSHTLNLGDCTLCHTTVTFSAPFFNHARVGISIQGAHIPLIIDSCQHCHPAGTYSGITFVCSNCHGSQVPSIDGIVHTSRTMACEQCHNQGAFKPAAFKLHNSFQTKLSGAHAPLECATCHPVTTSNWLNINYRDGIAYGSCANCHKRNYRYPHEGHTGLPADANCGRCHGYSNFN